MDLDIKKFESRDDMNNGLSERAQEGGTWPLYVLK